MNELTIKLDVQPTVAAWNALRTEVDGAKTGLEDLTRYVAELTTVDETNLAEVEEVFNDTHAAITAIEALRKEAKAPWLAGGKAVDDLAAPVLKTATAVKTTLATKIAQARSAIARKREEAMREAAKAAEKRDHETSVAHVVVAQALAQTDTKVEGCWAPEIVYPQSVPNQYWKIDTERLAGIGKATPLDAQPPAISGIVWRKHETVRAKAVRR